MIAEDIEIAVARFFGVRAQVIVPNASWGVGVHECDLLILSRSGYLTEIEIKITKADLIKDLKKQHGHRSEKIKKLYYAIPTTVLEKNGVVGLIPVHAGVLGIRSRARQKRDEWGLGLADKVEIVREAEENRIAKPLRADEKFQLARLGAIRIWGLKERLQQVREAMK